MSTILDLSEIAQRWGQPSTIWRDQLLPAMFRGQQFHMESISRENGTHVVTHQFPKRDIPYSEPMGRRAYEFTIRAYCIAYPFNTNQPLYQRDYRTPRNNLINVLDAGQPGILQLPTLPPMTVLCTRYRITEEEKLGGYCTFDISFVEYGVKPTASGQDTFAQTLAASETLKTRVQAVLAQDPTAFRNMPPQRPPSIQRPS
jgi:prophage DNA circulation protein